MNQAHNRSNTVSFRLSEFERLALERLALADRRKPADYLRETIRQEAQRRGFWKITKNGEGVDDKK